jgi:hypothetical protein
MRSLRSKAWCRVVTVTVEIIVCLVAVTVAVVLSSFIVVATPAASASVTTALVLFELSPSSHTVSVLN